MGQSNIRRLLIIEAMTRIKRAIKNGSPKGSWLEQMLEGKPRMLSPILGKHAAAQQNECW